LGSQILFPVLLFMDDTGATHPAISNEDLHMLSIPDEYNYWVEGDDYTTMKGDIYLERIMLEAAFSDVLLEDFPPVSSFVIHPDDQSQRLGGPILRSLMFQGTLPDNGHRLAVASTRTGLQVELRDHGQNPA
jgi:hypothetical protein